MLVLEGGLVIVAILLGAIFGIAPLRTFRFDIPGLVAGASATLPMLAVLGLLWRSHAGFVREIRLRVEEVVALMFRDASIGEIAMVCVAAGLGEEALFRGFVQGGLEAWLGTWPALALASAIFGIAHPVTPAYIAIAAVIGAYLGGIWIWSGNLIVPVLAHALYDFVALVAMVRRHRSTHRFPTAT
jgi:hypothetical protein